MNVSAASERDGASSFTTTLGDALFKPRTDLSAEVELVDVEGELGVPGGIWRVEGKPVQRRGYIAAALLFVSDMQEG